VFNLVFCLMGPTASGKTALAFELIKHFPFEIISVDSAMIYREMDIGTAKPSTLEMQLVPHHLIDIKNPTETYSAAQFCNEASLLCDAILGQGKIPLLVGGTMMYFHALQNGISILPEANEPLRRQLEEEALQQGWLLLHQRLTEIDPITAARIHAHDTQRIQRALEVYYLTGKTLSALCTEQKTLSTYRFINLGLFPEKRSALHEAIVQRFDQMLTLGLVEEVEQLQKKWDLSMDLPAMRCVGYRQVFDYLHGHFEYAMMRDKGIVATRQLAKRQLTWLRHWEDIRLYDPQHETFIPKIIAKIQEILDNESLSF
jgi:tRNA dimethylallyltransferase